MTVRSFAPNIPARLLHDRMINQTTIILTTRSKEFRLAYQGLLEGGRLRLTAEPRREAYRAQVVQRAVVRLLSR